jgi:hypothetical protein
LAFLLVLLHSEFLFPTNSFLETAEQITGFFLRYQ